MFLSSLREAGGPDSRASIRISSSSRLNAIRRDVSQRDTVSSPEATRDQNPVAPKDICKQDNRNEKIRNRRDDICVVSGDVIHFSREELLECLAATNI